MEKSQGGVLGGKVVTGMCGQNRVPFRLGRVLGVLSAKVGGYGDVRHDKRSGANLRRKGENSKKW